MSATTNDSEARSDQPPIARTSDASRSAVSSVRKAAPRNSSPGRRAELIAAAYQLLDAEGFEAVTIRRLGALVGIQGPSVYKHVPHKAAVENALVAIGFTEQTDAFQGVPTPFAALAGAYRNWALAHPHVHRLLNDRPIDSSQLPDGVEERAAAPLIAACDGDLALARAAWATIKGLVDFELAHRFPPGSDIDAAYAAAARVYAVPAPDVTAGRCRLGDEGAAGGRGGGL